MGDKFISFENLEKTGSKILKNLCEKGQLKIKKN